MTRTLILAAGMMLALAAPAHAQLPGLPDLTVTAKHDAEPVVLKGSSFGTWSVPANQTFQPPLMDLVDCPPGTDTDTCDHNEFADPAVDTASDAVQGTPVNQLVGYRWDPGSSAFVQIPFQVDEVFTRYLSNEASGFSIYSGQDQHTTYAYDREGFRYTKSDPADPCHAIADSPAMRDPVKGLDSNDELAFMASDAGPRAPAGAIRPAGIDGVKEITIADPQTGAASYVYVMLARTVGPRPAYDGSNGYVHYQRDANADTFVHSESSYQGYGNAAQGTYCTPDGQVAGTGRRRPLDTATITTDRYRFRYDGRWLMTDLRIKPDPAAPYGPDLVDRWKARAFAQDPSSETPCCGYEEEDTNWGGSSTLLGEKVGPVRAIRETWGADSGTNVIRRETFYRRQMDQKTWLRVHVIPPLDGIYAQWDFNANRMTQFFNSRNPAGVKIDGRNDEAFGNLDDPCNPKYDANDTSQFDQTYRTLYAQFMGCSLPYHLSMDASDPTFSQPNVLLDWGVTSGPYGSVVDRISSEVTDLTPGGAAQSVAAVPYYRDDSCFDDGTGSDPGPKVDLRKATETATASDGTPRRCWHTTDGDPDGSDHYYQGSIGTHGLHLLFQVDSDNARLTEPVDEIVSNWRMVMLPGQQGAQAGEEYGRGLEKPLLPVALDRSFAAPQGAGSPPLPPPPPAQGPPPGGGSAPPPPAAGSPPPGASRPATHKHKKHTKHRKRHKHRHHKHKRHKHKHRFKHRRRA
jgi:hypothetical protein